MLILGIILTTLGFIIFQWDANMQSKPFFERPLMFSSNVAVLIINLIWLGLLIGGFYSLWQINSKIVLTFIGIYATLWGLGYLMGGEKMKAKKIFKIYRQLKLFRPKASDEEIFRETANTYFRSLGWNKNKIKMTLDAIFEEQVKGEKDKTIKDIANSILVFESPCDDLMSYDLTRSMKCFSKRQKAIDEAYDAIISHTTKVTERPKLSKNIIKWIKSIGLNPDKMTSEQLAVFLEMDDLSKSNWIIRFLYGVSFVFVISAGINLITLEIGSVLSNSVISFVFWYIGYRIQMKRISKKFYEASIMKYAQEQAEKDE